MANIWLYIIDLSIGQGALPWQPILGAKLANSPSFIALVSQNEVKYRNIYFKRLHGINLAHHVKIGELWSINSGVYEGESRTPLVDQQFSYVRLTTQLLDTAAISTEFSGAISNQFCFIYLLGGVIVMPRGLHASHMHLSGNLASFLSVECL